MQHHPSNPLLSSRWPLLAPYSELKLVTNNFEYKKIKINKLTLRNWGGVMLLRLSPAPVRPSGHAVHRAPDAERNQHPGYGAAGHFFMFFLKRKNKPHTSVVAECGHRCAKETERTFQCTSYILVPRSKSQSSPHRSVRSLSSARPQCAGYQAVGVIYLGMAYIQPGRGGGGGGGRSNKKRDPTTHAACSTLKWGRHTFSFFVSCANFSS